MPQTKYSIVDFTVVQGGLETTYATPPGSLVTLPVYNATEPLVTHQQGSEAIELANSSLSPSQFYVTEPTVRFSATTYVYCSDPANPPPWASIMLPPSGFLKAKYSGTAPTLTGAGSINLTTSQSADPGGLPNGTYKYTVAIVNDRTHPTNPGDQTPADQTGVSVNVSGGPSAVTLSMNAPAANTFYRIYRTEVGGSVFYHLADLAPGENSYVDTVQDNQLNHSIVAPGSSRVGHVYFVPKSEHFDSLYMEVFMHGHKCPLAGARGTWTMDAESGRAVATRWDITGLYLQAQPATNPSIGGLNPGIPFIFRSASVGLYRYGGPKIGTATAPLVVKSFSLSPGTQVENRRDAQSQTGVIEIGIHRRFDSRFELVIEVPRQFSTDQFDAVHWYDQMAEFNCVMTFGTANAKVNFIMPRLQLSEAPAVTNQDNGILSWRAVFRPRSLFTDDWLRIEFSN
ncbi:MAG: hypothetical protein KatS3mg054_0114 [Chloroflexus sp.]|nr:MAG: hypothetical protein KatS3mg054_0114 [Chloroflexus sp.]